MIVDKKKMIQGWIKADSTNIYKYRYSKESKVFSVCFFSNKNVIYNYADVPLSVYLYFVQSDEKGSFFSAKIKERFKFTKS